MDKHQPIFGVIIGTVINLLGCILGTFLGKHSVAGPILQAAFTDIGLQTSQIGNRTGIYAVEPLKRNRVNTAYMLGVFFGQLMGTGVGNAIYARGGWVHSGAVNIAFVGASLLLCFVKGPRDAGWFRYGNGWNMKVKPKVEKGDDVAEGQTITISSDNEDLRVLDAAEPLKEPMKGAEKSTV